MTSFDKRLLKFWVAVTAIAAAMLFLPGLGTGLALSGIGLPFALVFALMPGLWLYLTPSLAIYLLLRRRVRKISGFPLLMVAALPPLLVGIAVAVVANQSTDRHVRRLLAGDRGSPIKLPRGSSVTHLIHRDLGSIGKCHEDCQRLLLSGTAASYADVPRDLIRRLGELPSPATRFELGPRDGNCRNELLTAVRASDEEVGHQEPKPLLWNKAYELDLCLHAESVRDVRSDFLMVHTWNYEPRSAALRLDRSPSEGPLIEPRLRAVSPFTRWEIFRNDGGRFRLVMRRTLVENARLRVPLWLVPGFAFETYTPARWALTDRRSSGHGIERYSRVKWEPWITNDIGVRPSRDQ